MKSLKFKDWMALTRSAEKSGPESPHFYLQLNSVGPYA